MSLKRINDFLSENYGVSERVYQNIYNKRSSAPIFFMPYRFKSDPLFRAASIVTAPICYSIYALEKAIGSIVYILKSIGSLAMLHPNESLNSLKYCFDNLLQTGINLLAAVMSPIINTLALIGGGVATVYGNENKVPPIIHVKTISAYNDSPYPLYLEFEFLYDEDKEEYYTANGEHRFTCGQIEYYNSYLNKWTWANMTTHTVTEYDAGLQSWSINP